MRNYSFKKNYKFYITVFITILCFLTTLISVGFGALNQNLNIAGDIEYEKDTGNMIMSWTSSATTDFHSSTYRTKIKTVDFLDTKNVPGNAVETWDISAEPNSGKVMAWIIDDPNNSGYYKLYIGANGDVVGNVDSGYIFYGMTNLEIINFNNNFDTSKVTNMYGMFYNCGNLTSLDVSNFNTSNVTSMSTLFYNCGNLTSLDVSNFSTSNVTSMFWMFRNCSGLTSLDVTNFNTSNVKNMSQMFEGCNALASLDVGNFNTNNVINMSGMFRDCNRLTNLDVSNFNTNQVTDMSNMFSSCDSLTSLNLSNFNTSKVTTMSNMFSYCSSLTSLDVSSFNTSQVTSMSYMFEYCTSLTSLNLTTFNTIYVTKMDRMFYECRVLTEIKISSLWNVSNVTVSTNMFFGCSRLPNFDSNNIQNITWAKPTTQGGYLTLVASVKTFSYENVNYQFESGMTWADWINSSYNNDGFTYTGNYVRDYNNEYITKDGSNIETPSDVIIENTNYYIYR